MITGRILIYVFFQAEDGIRYPGVVSARLRTAVEPGIPPLDHREWPGIAHVIPKYGKMATNRCKKPVHRAAGFRSTPLQKSWVDQSEPCSNRSVLSALGPLQSRVKVYC